MCDYTILYMWIVQVDIAYNGWGAALPLGAKQIYQIFSPQEYQVKNYGTLSSSTRAFPPCYFYIRDGPDMPF